ncbi:unnamed protein product, partial [Tilletia caries]
MASELCSHVGTGNNAHPCRICKYGGTKAYKNSAEGLKSMFKIGAERTSVDTIDALSGLVKIAVEGKSTEYFSHQSSSGAKDVIVEEVTDILFELRRILSGKVPSHPRTPARKQTKADILQDVQTEATALQSCEWYNALLTLSDVCGFAVHAQSPVECLHTLWLGPVKYLAIATVHMMDKDLLRTQLEALDTDGLECGSVLRAKYLLDHVVSLTGKEFKLLAQSMPAALPPLVHKIQVSRRLQDAWAAVGRMAKVICAPSIARNQLDAHIKEVEAASIGLYRALSFVCPLSLASKPKFHMLAHLADNVRRFGPSSNFNT